jgi:hypothetical protein
LRKEAEERRAHQSEMVKLAEAAGKRQTEMTGIMREFLEVEKAAAALRSQGL